MSSIAVEAVATQKLNLVNLINKTMFTFATLLPQVSVSKGASEGIGAMESISREQF